jgi:hypothetical protein
VLDSCIPDDLEDAAITAEELVSQAKPTRPERSSQFETSTMRPKSIPVTESVVARCSRSAGDRSMAAVPRGLNTSL